MYELGFAVSPRVQVTVGIRTWTELATATRRCSWDTQLSRFALGERSFNPKFEFCNGSGKLEPLETLNPQSSYLFILRKTTMTFYRATQNYPKHPN